MMASFDQVEFRALLQFMQYLIFFTNPPPKTLIKLNYLHGYIYLFIFKFWQNWQRYPASQIWHKAVR